MQLEAQQRILGFFIEEARDHLHTLEQGLMELRQPDEDGERMKELFRAAHSIKGGAAMLGLSPIRSISHRLEDHFKILQEKPATISEALENLMLRTVDILQGLLAGLQSPGGIDPELEQRAIAEAEPLMLAIERCLNGLPPEPPPAPSAPEPPLPEPVLAEPPAPEPSPAPPAPTLADLFAPAAPPGCEDNALEGRYPNALESPAAVEDLLTRLFTSPAPLEEILGAPLAPAALEPAPAALTNGHAPGIEAPPAPVTPAPPPMATAVAPPAASAARQAASARRTMRVEVRLLDGLNNLAGELVINRNSLETQQNRLRQFLETLQLRTQQLNRVSQTLAEQYDKGILGIRANRLNAGGVAGSAAAAQYVDRAFDALEMDQYTVFHTISQEIMELIVRIREASADLEFVTDEAEEATRQLRYISTQLQDGLNQIRMLPLAEIADRLPRAVRDLSTGLGKEVDLVIEGRETLIDKAILEELYDPLTHLVTNALIHGLEDPRSRIERGKSPRGRIEVRAYHQGNQTLIAVSDDGRGLDAERIRTKAIEKGLIAREEARGLADSELFPLIFTPGFSTATSVTEMAGRGVGLDVVQNHLNRMRGTIQIESRRHQGTTFTIRLPLTLSISRAVLCLHHQSTIAIPLDGIEEMIELPAERIYEREGKQYIRWRDRELGFMPLLDLLPYFRDYQQHDGPLRGSGTVATVILRSGETFLAIRVDGFLEEQEIVIKQLRGPVQRPPGIAGATVLGNGQVLPIVDVGELIATVLGQMPLLPWTDLPEPVIVPTPNQQTILIVDDSITVRELLSMTFTKVGYRVEQARDGQEALDKLRSGLMADAVFCDVEMPRMDGFEFLAQVQKDERFTGLPVAMLTSRSADKHRQTAQQLGAKGYFTKPYLEEELLQGAARLLRGEKVGNDSFA